MFTPTWVTTIRSTYTPPQLPSPDSPIWDDAPISRDDAADITFDIWLARVTTADLAAEHPHDYDTSHEWAQAVQDLIGRAQYATTQLTGNWAADQVAFVENIITNQAATAAA